MENRYQKIVLGLMLIVTLESNSYAQNKNITYTGDTVTMFANPERGWYDSYSPDCCDKPGASCELPPIELHSPHKPIVLSDLKALRNTPERITLYRDIIKINQYSGPIPKVRLDEIQADLNIARSAGVKVVFRIIYNYSINTGEPCANIIDGHLDQLKPIIEKNSDIIFCVQAGLFGGSGEACCQSWLIDRNNNGWSSLSTKAKTLYNKLISYVPKDRFVNLRYPRYKYQMMDWINTDIQSQTTYHLIKTNTC